MKFSLVCCVEDSFDVMEIINDMDFALVLL